MKINKINPNSLSYCVYYTGVIERSQVWILVSALRGTEHVCFDRTLDVQNSVFEFFVPTHMELVFLEVMTYLQNKGVVICFSKQDNRLLLYDETTQSV